MITRQDVDKVTKATTDRSKAILGQVWLGLRVGAGHAADYGRNLATFTRTLATLAHGARKLWLFLIEIIGVVLVTWGISLWSIPSAIIIGGLVLIAVIELRPLPGPKFPDIPVPEEVLRHQARSAAEAINNERFGLAIVDPEAFEKLSRNDCEKIITLAKAVGAKKT